MSKITISETSYTVAVSGDHSITVTESPVTVEVRGGIASSVDDLTTQANITRLADDILAWNATTGQFEPARISASGGVTLSFVFLSDLDWDYGSLDFSFSEASGLLNISGVM